MKRTESKWLDSEKSSKLEADIRSSQKIKDDWTVDGSGSSTMAAMLAVTFTALIQQTIALVKNIAGGQATFLVDGLQFIVAVLLMVLGVLVAFSCLKKLFGKSSAGQAA